MSYSNWDKGRVNEDGTISGNWYVADVDYQACYELYNREPVGDKMELRAEAALEGKRYVIRLDGVVVAPMPTSWPQLGHAVKSRGPLIGTGALKWRQYDDPQRFMVYLYLKHV